MTVRAAAPTLKTSAPEGTPSLSWNAVNGATKYWVYRSTDGKEFKYYDSTTKTAYTNKSVDAGKTYYYKVKAVNVVNGTSYASGFSNSVSVLVK
ncbi:bacterial group 2 Ig-like protein [Firmicutes bacterium CAG:555]|nr:bacterial group 2 Ig-like protein [Firmicutes bacterium CAG:555]